MPTLEYSCEIAANQAATLINGSFSALSIEEKAYWNDRSYNGDAKKVFKTHVLWALIEMLGMSVEDLE